MHQQSMFPYKGALRTPKNYYYSATIETINCHFNLNLSPREMSLDITKKGLINGHSPIHNIIYSAHPHSIGYEATADAESAVPSSLASTKM